ncbi:MAG: arginine deiminase [Ndongobacter sp.]|nr:arginine deiminase [Ndongobacter sp.]
MSAIQVYSEIDSLREVLLHRPGEELLNLTPGMLGELLFDDIPYLRQAQREHDAFSEILRGQGVKVTYLVDLLVEVFEAKPELVEPFLRQFIREGDVRIPYYQDALLDYFRSSEDVRQMIHRTMMGVTLRDLDLPKREHLELVELIGARSIFLLDPIPNLYFTRDMLSTMGAGVVIPRMFSQTRSRETIYTSLIFHEHPRFCGQVPEFYNRDSEFNIEGGDILNLREDLIAVGISQRTSPEAVQQLANTLFYHSNSPIRKILAIRIPNTRAFMHLDTVFTQIDHDAFTYHPGMMENLRFFVLRDRDGHIDIQESEGSLEEMLRSNLDLTRVRLFPCGGGDRIAAEREQWNDGSNTLAIAPGTIITYDRNERTNALLEESGFTVLEMPSFELSRGRGGPRCMSMPLIRGKQR